MESTFNFVFFLIVYGLITTTIQIKGKLKDTISFFRSERDKDIFLQ